MLLDFDNHRSDTSLLMQLLNQKQTRLQCHCFVAGNVDKVWLLWLWFHGQFIFIVYAHCNFYPKRRNNSTGWAKAAL